MWRVWLSAENAVCEFDILSELADLEYAALVRLREPSGELAFERVFDGQFGSSRVEFRDSRIRNVFGGAQPAGFVANSDMERLCNAPGTSLRSQTGLEERAILDIARKIAREAEP